MEENKVTSEKKASDSDVTQEHRPQQASMRENASESKTSTKKVDAVVGGLDMHRDTSKFGEQNENNKLDKVNSLEVIKLGELNYQELNAAKQKADQ